MSGSRAGGERSEGKKENTCQIGQATSPPPHFAVTLGTRGMACASHALGTALVAQCRCAPQPAPETDAHAYATHSRRRRSDRHPPGPATPAERRGLRHRSGELGRRRAGALHQQPYDLLLMDLNYTRDTTSGREGLDLLERVRDARRCPADRRDDRLGQHRHRRRGDAARGAQLRAEAVGRHDARRSRPARDRRRPGVAAARRAAGARAGRGAPDPARAAALVDAGRHGLRPSPRAGRPRRASAATATTSSASPTRASRCRLPTSSARACRRRS